MKKKKKKNQPKINEEEFIEVINKITKKLSYKFKFGYHDVEDMKQQATIFAIEALEKYDHKRPLENFLWTHVRNRLFNYKRDNYQRPDKPCLTCPLYDPKLQKSNSGCTKFDDKRDCDLYRGWESRNERKKNLMQLSYIHDNNETLDNNNLLDSISNKEIITTLENNLTYEYREIYLKLKNGEKIKNNDMKKLKKEILNILENGKNT